MGTTTTIKDSSGNSVKVPKDFKIASDSANNVSDGVVIEDTKGNQFVWIPVTNSQQYVRNTSYEDAWSSSGAGNDTGYLPSGIADEKQAVLSAGGFYIARYEAGNESNVVVSKKGAQGWSGISQANCKTVSKTFVNNAYVKKCTNIWDPMGCYDGICKSEKKMEQEKNMM